MRNAAGSSTDLDQILFSCTGLPCTVEFHFLIQSDSPLPSARRDGLNKGKRNLNMRLVKRNENKRHYYLGGDRTCKSPLTLKLYTLVMSEVKYLYKLRPTIP